METCQLAQAEEAIGTLTKSVNPFNHWRFVRGATRPFFFHKGSRVGDVEPGLGRQN